MSIIKGLHARIIANQVKEIMDKKGYSFFESGIFNVNIVGIRASDKQANVFNDSILLKIFIRTAK